MEGSEVLLRNPNLRFYSPSIDSPTLLNPWQAPQYGSSPIFRSNLFNNIQQGKESYKPEPIFSGGEISENEKILKWPEEEPSASSDGFSLIAGLENCVNSKMEKSPFADDIIDFLNPFLAELKHMSPDSSPSEEKAIQHIIELLHDYGKRNHDKAKELMQLMNVPKLVVPYIELDLPGEIILEYNGLEEDDPLVLSYQLNPLLGKPIRELGVFLDRYDTRKEVLCLFVWSTVDNTLICLPSVGLIPFPLCWMCKESFGMHSCSNCGVAKYCSKECQALDWKVIHKTTCPEMTAFTKKHKMLSIE